MKTKLSIRLLSLLLVLVLCIGFLPLGVFAQEIETGPAEETEVTTTEETIPEEAAPETEPAATTPGELPDSTANTVPEITQEPTAAETTEPQAAPTEDPTTDDVATTPTEAMEPTEAPVIDAIPSAADLLQAPTLMAANTLVISQDHLIFTDGHDDYYFPTYTTQGSIKKIYNSNGYYASDIYTLTLNGKIAFCIQPTTRPGGSYSQKSDLVAWEQELSNNQKVAISLAMYYGYPMSDYGVASPAGTAGDPSLEYPLNTALWQKNEKIAATQIVIWEIVMGFRIATPPYKVTNSSLYNAFAGNWNTLKMYYNTIGSKMAQQRTIPSFTAGFAGAAPTIKLQPDGKGNYTAKVTDTNNVLDNYDFKMDGVTFTKSGNVLTISAPASVAKTLADAKACRATNNKGAISIDPDKTVAVWAANNGGQAVVSPISAEADPVPAYFKLQADAVGHAAVAKTSEDGKVSGIQFELLQGSTVLEKKATDANGNITFNTDLLDGSSYTIHEIPKPGYVPQPDQTFKAVANETVTVTFRNVLKKGSLKVTKAAEDRLVQGVKFHLSGTSLTGQAVDLYAVTNADGVAVFSDVPVGTGYTLEEVDTATRYVVPRAQIVEIKWSEVTEASVSNVLKKWSATITKADRETGYAQGDGSLSGAVYGVYNGEALVDTYTTGTTGRITTKEYLCGDAWTIREISPSEGYLLDPTVYSVGAEAGNFTIEHNTLSADVKETAIKGRISILKIAGGNGQSGIQTPEDGAEFQIWRTAAGSFDAARDAEKDVLTTDRNGFGQTKYLPYGTYTVHQSKGWADTIFVEDFQVTISADGETYHYTLNNAWKTLRIQAVKVDRETGSVIPVAGVGFQFFDAKGNKLIYEVTYPTPAVIDTYYTGEDGTLVTPWELKHGTYTAVEVVAPAGYVLDSTPVTFKVSDDSATTTVGGLKVMRVEISDLPQMGRIEISKTGEGLVSVIETDGLYTPVWGETGVAGATFEIRAAKDIVTEDGTLRYHAGDLVDTVVTGADGKATSKALYLGPYTVTETEAPAGYVLDTTSYTAELTYAGQDVEITSTQIGLHNDRQRAAISLVKSLEQDETFQLGMNGEIQNVVFGLYAAEEITALDGSEIPADGLIDMVTVGADGKAAFAADPPLGSYYAQEIATDEHYVLSDAKYPLTFKADSAVATTEIWINNGEAIENKLIRGRIHGYKLGEDQEPLAGATFGLFPAGTTEYYAETALALAVSDETGEFVFEGVPFGKYAIKELEAPMAHVADDRVYEVEISENAQTVGINVPNALIRGAVQLTKVDKNYPENKLTGAKFTVYRDLNGDGKLDEGELKTAMDLPEIGGGVYRLEALEWGKYLMQETEAPDGYYLDDGIYAFEIVTDGETVVVENEAGTGCFVNQHVPELHTTASIEGKEEAYFGGKITVKDAVSYKYLIVGKEYTISGKLMDKSTGKPFLVDGKEVFAELTFTAEKSEGTIDMEFTFDSSSLTVKTDLVVFETMTADGAEVGAHADLTDVGQTVTLAPQPKVPHTGSIDMLRWATLGILGVLILATGVVLLARKRKIQ